MVIFLIGSVAALFLFVVLGIDDYGKWSINPRQIGAALVLAITLGVSMVTLVPTGYTGILTSFGKVEDRTIQAGLNITAPWQKVVKMDNRAQKETMRIIKNKLCNKHKKGGWKRGADTLYYHNAKEVRL